MTFLIQLLLSSSFDSFVSSVTASAASACLQTNFGDASYSGGMVYDPLLKVVYVTGQVGPSSCFVGALQKQQHAGENSSDSFTLQMISKQVFAESAICQTLTLRADQPSTPLLLTVMEEGGLLTDTRPVGSQKATQYGALIELQLTSDGSSSTYATDRSVLLHQDMVQIPRSIVVDPIMKSNRRVFVALMSSQSSDVRREYDNATNANSSSEFIPNMTPSGYLKYGKNYAMTIESLRLAPSSTSSDSTSITSEDLFTASSQWKKPFGVAGDVTEHGVTVSQLLYHGSDELIVVGYTQGSGSAYGQAALDDDPNMMAGFIAKFNPDHGELQLSRRFHIERESQILPTFVEAICQDDGDPESLFIVGSFTNNRADSSTSNFKIPFVTKLAASDLHQVWEKTFAATTDAYALACGVSPDGNHLYVAGTVEAGGELMGQTTTHLLDDIFVLQLSTKDGYEVWIKQLGSAGHDRLSHGGTGLVVVENDKDGREGGVLLLGDTTGNLCSTSSSHASEVFVVHVDPQGNTSESSEFSGVDYSQGHDDMAVSSPVRMGGDDSSSNQIPQPTVGPESNTTSTASDNAGTPSKNAPTSTPDESASEDFDESANTTSSAPFFVSEAGQRMYFLMAIVIFILVGCCCYVCFQQREKEKKTERALVFSYLQAFDVEDIDVRHSVTGGWHGTYVGKLAKGQVVSNHDDVDNMIGYNDDPCDGTLHGSRRQSLRSLTGDGTAADDNGTRTLLPSFSHSSIVKDSLFVDYDTTPTYGKNSRRSSRSSYLSDDEDDDDYLNDRNDLDALGGETFSFVRDPTLYSVQKEKGFNLAQLSRKSPGGKQHVLDPWGKEIV